MGPLGIVAPTGLSRQSGFAACANNAIISRDVPSTPEPTQEFGSFLADETRRLGSTNGVRFIYESLNSLVEQGVLVNAIAVIEENGNRQVFNSGRVPLSAEWHRDVAFNRPPGVYTQPALVDDVDTLEALHRLCGVAFRLEQLQHDCMHDRLTGLYNRRAFDEMLQGAVSRSKRYGWEFTLVLLDMDKLKQINDSFGHPVGDAVLQVVGASLRASVRTGDVAARLGGDEFALILPASDDSGVPPVLERLQIGINAHGVDNVSLSAGRATCPGDADNIADLYRIADERLYAEKRKIGARSATRHAD
jgi:diguanylate cyclase (GGDEF)-like protein